MNGTETCDDGQVVPLAGDGCNTTCHIEAGYTCTIDPPDVSVCLTSCGNALKNPLTEQCDDGGIANGDGCSSTCTIEPGFLCTGTHNETCIPAPVCGDGLKHSVEACDDGNLNNFDGCSSTCLIEANSNCIVVGTLSICDICGNFV